jgi:DNA polymerase V
VPKNLNHLLQPYPDQIRHMRLGSDEAKGLGLCKGDLLIIDTSIKSQFGDLVVANIFGQCKPRRLQRMSGQIILAAQTFSTPDTFFESWAQMDLLGVVTHSIRSHTPASEKIPPSAGKTILESGLGRTALPRLMPVVSDNPYYQP